MLGPVLERASDPHALCAVCAQHSTWVVIDDRRKLLLCSRHAASVLFSSIETTGQLLRHLDEQDRAAILFELWPSKAA